MCSVPVWLPNYANWSLHVFSSVVRMLEFHYQALALILQYLDFEARDDWQYAHKQGILQDFCATHAVKGYKFRGYLFPWHESKVSYNYSNLYNEFIACTLPLLIFPMLSLYSLLSNKKQYLSIYTITYIQEPCPYTLLQTQLYTSHCNKAFA